jgi:hypothetical protein
MIGSNISAAASFVQTCTVQNIPDRASGTADSSSVPTANNMGMVILNIPETIEELHLSLKDFDEKIKAIDVKLAANTFIESISKALLSAADAAATTAFAAGTGSGGIPAVTKDVMAIKDLFKVIIDGVNVWRATDGLKSLESSTDAFTFAIHNIGSSIGCSEETTAKAASYGGYILNALSDVAGTFAGLFPATLSSDQKKTSQYVSLGTAGAKALAGVLKPQSESLNAQKARLEKMKAEIEELIRQKQHEIDNPPKASTGIQKNVESKNKGNDTTALTKTKDKKTSTRFETIITVETGTQTIEKPAHDSSSSHNDKLIIGNKAISEA